MIEEGGGVGGCSNALKSHNTFEVLCYNCGTVCVRFKYFVLVLSYAFASHVWLFAE